MPLVFILFTAKTIGVYIMGYFSKFLFSHVGFFFLNSVKKKKKSNLSFSFEIFLWKKDLKI